MTAACCSLLDADRKLDLYIAAFQEITCISSNFAIAPAELGTASSILVRKRIQCPYLCGQFFNELLGSIRRLYSMTTSSY